MNLSIYVCGPVLRPSLPAKERILLTTVYGTIETEALRLGDRPMLPYQDQHLEQLGDNAFAREIEARISEADAVLTVLLGDRASVGFEGKLASELGKKQALIVSDPGNAPRLLTSLPFVTGTFGGDSTGIAQAIESISGERASEWVIEATR